MMSINNKKMSFQELIDNFQFILHIVKSELGSNRYSGDVEFYILSLIFYKRYVDWNSNNEEVSFDEHIKYWREIRNLASHNHSGIRGIAEILDESFYRLEKSDPILDNIFCGISFKNCDFISSIFAIILHLDRLDLSKENVSNYTMGRAFDFVVNTLFSKYKGKDITNPELGKLMINLINPNKYDKIYDPFVGGGSFLIEAFNYVNVKYFNPNIGLYGEEVSNKFYCICRMNLFMSGIDFSEIKLGDSILSPGFVNERDIETFDKIYTQIPSSTRNDNYYYKAHNDEYNRFNYGLPPRHSFDLGFVQHIISSLNYRGQAAVIVSKKMLTSEGNEALIRESIIKSDLVDAVIALSDEFNNYKQEMAMLIIDKNKPAERKGKIIFINTKIYNKNTSSGKKKLDIKRIEKIYKNFINMEGISRIVDLGEVVHNKFNLNFNRYDPIFSENEFMLMNGEGKKLRDIVNILPEIPFRFTEENNEGYPYIRIRDLNHSIEEKTLFTQDLEKRKLLINNKEVLSQKAIIIALIGEKLKATIFDPEYGPQHVILGQNTLAILPNEDFIDLEYLYYQLYSPRVLKQIEYLITGMIPRIRKNDFLDIVVSVPSISAQHAFIRIQKLSLVELDNLRTSEKNQKMEMENVAYNVEKDVIGILSHNTLPYITNMQFALNSLSRYLVRNDLMNENINELDSLDFTQEDLMFIEDDNNDQETVRDVFDRVSKYLKSFEDIIVKTKETVQLKLTREDFEEVNIAEIFREIVELKRNECQEKYEINVECPNVYVKLHKISFKELVTQLLRNAEMHAFDFNNKNNKYLVKFKIIEREENIMITYSNNGKIFELSQEDFISPLKKTRDSSGNGLGGSYIQRVVDAHSGVFEINKKSKGMEMIIIIPKKVGDIE